MISSSNLKVSFAGYKILGWHPFSFRAKPLATLTKRRREKNQITKIRNEQGNITTDRIEIQNQDINRFLETYELPKLNEEDIHNLNRPISK